MIGTPLFVPSIGENGVANRFKSTRMWMHHMGIKGAMGSGIYWKTMFTLSRNFGTYDHAFPADVFDPLGVGPYNSPLDEFSFLGELHYRGNKLPFQINVGIAGDYGDRFEHRMGGYAGISYQF